jgi:hypothetical protein
VAGDKIKLEVPSTKRDGTDADIIDDLQRLGSEAQWVIDELGRLSADALRYRCQPLKDWPPSTEGEWKLVEITPYWVLGQLGLEDPELAGTTLAVEVFKIVRIVHDDVIREVLKEVRAKLESEDDDLGW